MTYIIIKAKDIPGWETVCDVISTCGDVVINCDHIIWMMSFEDKCVLYMSNGAAIPIPDNIPIETNWDLIMCYHKKSTRIYL